jgi:chemotaxis signal transduction protein
MDLKDLSPVFSELDRQGMEMLMARAERLRGREMEGEMALEDGGWVAGFNLGGQAYALPLEQLLACQPLKGVASVPLSSPGCVGILRYGGGMIRVLSMASLLGSRGWRRDPMVLLILRTATECLALDCEEIPRVFQLSASVLGSDSVSGVPGLRELSLSGGGLLLLMDIDALLSAGKP